MHHNNMILTEMHHSQSTEY